MKPASVFVRFKESIFSDCAAKTNTFNMNEWRMEKNPTYVSFTETNKSSKIEEINIPWDNIVVMRIVNILE